MLEMASMTGFFLKTYKNKPKKNKSRYTFILSLRFNNLSISANCYQLYD